MTVAGLGLLVVRRPRGRAAARWPALARSGAAALLAAALGAAGRAAGRAARWAPTRCPDGGVLVGRRRRRCWPAAIVLVVAVAVMMGTARGTADRGRGRAPQAGRRRAGTTGGARWLRRRPCTAAGSSRCSPRAPAGWARHVRSLVPALRAAGAAVRRLRRARHRGAVRVHRRRRRLPRRSASPPGLAPARRQPRRGRSCARATAGADLVHAHGLRAGLVAAAARRLGRRPAPAAGADPAQRPAGERAAPSSGCCGRPRGRPIRGADLVLAVSSDLADNARRLGARDVRVAPGSRAAAAAGRALPRRGPRGARRRRRPPAASSPSAGCTRRRATTSCSTRSAGWDRGPAAAGPAGRRSPATGRCEDELAARDPRPSGCRSCCSAGAATSPTCSVPPTSACCPRAGRAARSPRRRRCAPARRWSPPAPAASPSCWAPAPTLVPVGRRRGARRRRRPRAHRPRARRRAGRGRPPAGGGLAGRGAPPRRQLVAVYRELLGAAGSRRADERAGSPARRAPGPSLAVLLGAPVRGRARPTTADAAADRVVVVGVPGPDLERRRPRGDARAVGAGRGLRRSARCRCARPGRPPACSTAGRPSARATAPGSRARTRACRRCRCRTVPLPDDEAAPTAAPTTAPTGAERRSRPRWTPRCRTAACRSGSPSVALADPAATVARTAEDEGTARFGAEPGALGEAVGCATVSGRAATLAVAVAGRGAHPRRRRCPPSPASSPACWRGCPLTLVSLDQLSDAGAPGVEKTDDGTDPGAAGGRARRASTRPSAGCGPPSTRCPATRCCCWPGISEVNDGRPQLHVGMAVGPGFTEPGWLTSASTGRAPVRPADRRGADRAAGAGPATVPASMNGQPLQVDRRAAGHRRGGRRAESTSTPAATVHHRNVGTLLLDRWCSSRRRSSCSAWLVLGGCAAPGRPARRGARAARCAALRSSPVAGRCRSPPTWPGSCRGSATGAPLLALAAAVLAADLRRGGRRRCSGPGGTHRLGPPLAVAGGHPRHPGPRRAHRLDAGAQRAARLRRDRGRPVHRLRQPQLRAAVGQRAAASPPPWPRSSAGRRAGPDGPGWRPCGTVARRSGCVTVAVIGAPGAGPRLRRRPGRAARLPAAGACCWSRVRVTVVRLGADPRPPPCVAVGTVAVLDWLRPAGRPQPPGPLRRAGAHRRGVDGGQPQGRRPTSTSCCGSPLAWMLPVALVAAVWLVRPGRPAAQRRSDDGAGAARPGCRRATRSSSAPACSPAR